jgi:hypothetical protein
VLFNRHSIIYNVKKRLVIVRCSSTYNEEKYLAIVKRSPTFRVKKCLVATMGYLGGDVENWLTALR